MNGAGRAVARMRLSGLAAWALLFWGSPSLAATVGDVRFDQGEQGLVRVRYALVDCATDTVHEVGLSLSPDWGRSFILKPRTLLGDGGLVRGCGSKEIVWDIDKDHPELDGPGFVFKVTAKAAAVSAPAPAGAVPAPPRPADPGGVKWVTIPGGTFKMGSEDPASKARPIHEVTMTAFQLAKAEVTVKQYKACVEVKACTHPLTGGFCSWDTPGRESHPVHCVDWGQAKAFCEWAGGRLPTEAEWEFAARSGGKSLLYPWGDEPATCEHAVMKEAEADGCGRRATWPVCSKERGRTEQGLCDMAGNVSEWVDDWHGEKYYGSSPERNPPGPSTGFERVVRGGSWNFGPEFLRASERRGAAPEARDYDRGIRCARSGAPK